MARDCDILDWVEQVRVAKPKMDALVDLLNKFTGIRVDPGNPMEVGALPYLVTIFSPCGENATVTMKISLMDYQTDADVVITNIATRPESQRGKGAGSHAVQALLGWALRSNFNQVRATQVHSANERFWAKCGFVKDFDPNLCNDFVWRNPNYVKQ